MKKRTIISGLVALFLLSGLHAQSKTVLIKSLPSGTDATPYVVKAIKECKATKATKLVFEKGTYHFTPEFAEEKYLFTSNNDEGLKRIVFNLSGMKNFEVDGQGSTFIFDGFVSPFLCDKSNNIRISNFSVDYKRTFHSEGTIVGAYTDSLDIQISKDYPYIVQNNKLTFTGDKIIGKDNAGQPKRVIYPFWHLLEFDSKKREPSPFAGDYLNVQNMVVKELSSDVIRIFYPRLKGTVGNVMVFNASDRMNSAITITDSENIYVNNVTIYHAGGMGVVGQRSRNIFLEKFSVEAPKGRMLSLVADATHYIGCGGQISMKNCKFESMMDDATNIHGIYVKIIELISPNEALVKLIHYQQFGYDFLFPGTKVEITEAESLIPYQENKVKKSVRINKEYTRVTFEQPISPKVKVGDVVASTQEYPDVHIKNCTLQKNRARGFLLGSRGKIVVEDCYFHTHCAAINLEGDGRFWFEQSGVRDLTIRNNVFDNCNYSFMLGLGVIQVNSGIEESKRAESRYNRNILIENNKFRVFNPCILSMYSVDNLTFRNNTIEKNDDYVLSDWMKNVDLKPFMITNSSNIKIEE